LRSTSIDHRMKRSQDSGFGKAKKRQDAQQKMRNPRKARRPGPRDLDKKRTQAEKKLVP